MRRIIPILTVLLLLVRASAAWGDDAKKRAAEHFALGEAAEKRSDWRAAIDQFKLAYDIKPHPAVLYKIARNYERLEDWDSAVDYYERYLEESPEASDRARVEERLEGLREKAVQSRPPPREGTGLLVVHANVDGAQVIIDGQVFGVTPFEGLVGSGPHTVEIVMPGHAPEKRQVNVSPGGTEQIRATLVRTGEAPDEPSPYRGGFLMGLAYGYTPVGGAMRLIWHLGWRTPEERAELNLFLGIFGPNDSGFGADVRWFFARDKVRPYAHLAATYGKATGSVSTQEENTYGLEAGVGVIFAPFNRLTTASGARSTFSMSEYYIEVNARYTLGGIEDTEAMPVETETVPFTLPIQVGFIIRF
jgi:hypothetical protein